MTTRAWAASKEIAHWLWRRTGAFIVVVLLIATFIFGFTLGSGPDAPDPNAGQSSHKGHDSRVSPGEVTEWICAMHPQIRKSKSGTCPICAMELTPASGGTAGEGMRRLTLSPQAIRLMDIQTTPVTRQFAEAIVSMVGKVDYDETRLGYITAYVGGRLDRLFVDYTGVAVKAGDHMVELYSPELLAAQEELLQAIKGVNSLKQSDIVILQETAQQTVEAAREKLRLWGLTKAQTDALEQRGTPQDKIVINSPLSGIVIHKNAQEGMYVQTGTRIYTIADLRQLWVKFDAYESDLAWLRYGQPVEFTTEAYPGEAFRGRIAFIDPVLDDVRRTVKVRVNVANEDGRLKPGMFARGRVRSKIASGGRVMDEAMAGKWISPMHPEIIKDKPGFCDKCGMPLVRAEELGYVLEGGQSMSKPLMIPASAALITGRRAIVYVQVPDAKQPTYEGREIVLGPRAGDHYIVLSNLQEGDQVVTHGNFKLDSELQLRAKPSMMTPDGGGGGGHDHGGKGSHQANPAPSASGLNAGAMNLPIVFIEQWRGVERAADRVQRAVEAGDVEPARQNYRRFLLALSDVDAAKLSGHSLAVWTEASMRLTNDATEGLHTTRAAQASRPFQLLTTDMMRVRAHLGLQILHVHPVDVFTTEHVGKAVNSMLEDYFAISAALAAGDPASAAAAAARLRVSLAKMDLLTADGPVGNHWRASKPRIDQTLNVLAGAKDLIAQRAAFLPLSQEVGKMVAVADDHLTTPVYEIKCPMAFDNAGATWLQRDRLITNPYFGKQMLRCGDVIATLSFDPALLAQIGDMVPIATALARSPIVADSPVLYEAENLDGLTAAYFRLAEAMTAGDVAQAKLRAANVLKALGTVKVRAQDGRVPDQWTTSSANLTTATAAISNAMGIEPARQQFALLSEELAAVLRVAGGSGSPVYRVKCTMAFNNRGATWLQNGKMITNPYFGDRMLRCGDVVETLAPRSLKGRQNTAWSCPLHPQIHQSTPGQCPICAQNLVPVGAEAPSQETKP